jgi:hypothetical protein
VHGADRHETFDENAPLATVLKKHPRLSFAPGSKYAYSNVGSWLLGKSERGGVHRVAGLKVENWLDRLPGFDADGLHRGFLDRHMSSRRCFNCFAIARFRARGERDFVARIRAAADVDLGTRTAPNFGFAADWARGDVATGFATGPADFRAGGAISIPNIAERSSSASTFVPAVGAAAAERLAPAFAINSSCST